jgi:hypothetical protein
MTLQLQPALLRRLHTVFLPVPAGSTPADQDILLGQFEAELAEIGYVLAADLRLALSGLAKDQLLEVSRSTLIALAEARGAHVWHVAQFRQFPRSTPTDTVSLYIDRVLSWLLQEPLAPCLLCGTVGTVQAVNPCGHLVCSHCFDGADYSGCPICHRRIDLDDPFLKPAPDRDELPEEHQGALVRLVLGTDIAAAARELATSLLRRSSPLNAQERDDFGAVIDFLGTDVLTCAPETGIPVRETQALVFGALLVSAADPAVAFKEIAPNLKTTTDVLRLLNVWMGGDAGLVEPRPRLRGMARAFRREVLERLETLPLERVNEDLRRHRARWLRLGEALRPFEYHNRFPQTALAFASLRQSEPKEGSPLAQTLLKVAGGTDTVLQTATKTRVRIRTFSARVEEALAANDLEQAITLLATRPGDLARRFDHLLRSTQADPKLVDTLLTALVKATPELPTPLILTLRATLRKRTAPLARRVFFPRGAVTRAYGIPDTRPTLDADLVGRADAILSSELATRAAKLAPATTAILDEALKDLLVPVAARTAAKSLVDLPRGSAISFPDGDEKLRLFLHWTDAPGQRIDLDLSVALYDADWHMVSLCDYTNLRAYSGRYQDAAVHSGDLTSAPAPLGASEFVDLDLALLREQGIRHVAMIVFSYNNIPFDRMEDAFAGFMRGRDQRGEIFDARTVEQRFDLVGDAKLAIPMIVDLEAGLMRWVDISPSAGDDLHSVYRHKGKIAHMCCDLHDYFSAGARPTLYEVAALHAGARAPEVQVRDRDGGVLVFTRADGESVDAFTARLLAGEGARASDQVSLNGGTAFAALLNGDLVLPDGSSVYALRTSLTPSPAVTQLAAADLVSALTH